ncbi:MAG: DegV family protein [Clostridia bacterium]|nr:DegV family protein [Clostridia bacterium]
MNIRLVSDSSGNIYPDQTPKVYSAPMKVVTTQKEYVDNDDLSVPEMLSELKQYKGKSSTACPSVDDWLQTFGDSDIVYGVSITSNLSGCYNSAMIAKAQYEEAHPEKKVFILDTLSTGPEMQLLLEKYDELIKEGFGFDQIVSKIKEYLKKTHLIFMLSALDNFAKNGRVNPVVAKAVGVLGIRIVGKASDEGTLEPMHKCRGERKGLVQLLETMKALGYKGGKVRLSHSYNPETAENFKNMILSVFPKASIKTVLNRGLCCYYAEEGGLLVGFES